LIYILHDRIEEKIRGKQNTEATRKVVEDNPRSEID